MYLRTVLVVINFKTFDVYTAPTVRREILFFKTRIMKVCIKNIIKRNAKSINENFVLNKHGEILGVSMFVYIKHPEDRSSHCCDKVSNRRLSKRLVRRTNDSAACDSLRDRRIHFFPPYRHYNILSIIYILGEISNRSNTYVGNLPMSYVYILYKR